jgi:leucyl aminopeptidase
MNKDNYLLLNNELKSGLSSSLKNCIKLNIIEKSQFRKWNESCSEELKNWIKTNDFNPISGATLFFPDNQLKLKEVFAVIENPSFLWEIAKIKKSLPEGNYEIIYPKLEKYDYIFGLAWALENYKFNPFNSNLDKKDSENKKSKLLIKNSTFKENLPLINGIYLARDLINCPANIINPKSLEEICQKLAFFHKAKIQVTKDKKLKVNFPAIYTVGRASEVSPRLIDISLHKNKNFPNITLVGKGVTFDSGGLDLKPPKAMELMKKDMGGAAIAIGLAHSIMMANLNLNIRLLVPAVENAVSQNSMRPLDILNTRSGIDVEIGNTDAEGRLILADTLYYADEKPTDLLIDFATLTGAARVALGTELPALFSNNDKESSRLVTASEEAYDPIFQMPLYEPYERFLNQENGSLSSTGSSPYGGAITAALFLKKFVKKDTSWMHLDIMGWNLSNLPGRPVGGEAMSLRAFFHYIKEFIRTD